MAAELNIVNNMDVKDMRTQHILTGKLDFATDRFPNGKLYGAEKLANISHGTIINIDASAAMAVAGVKAVVTAEDVPIWSPEIFHWGQPVAGVVATSRNIAMRAIQLIEVTYEERPAVIDPDEAMKDNVLCGIVPDTNYGRVAIVERGDVAAGYAASEVQLETTQGYSVTFHHNCFDSHMAVAWWIGEDLYFHSTSQHVHGGKDSTTNALGLNSARVHSFTHATGTGHGDKAGSSWIVIAAVMSRAVDGYPVELHRDRYEYANNASRTFASKSTIKIGCTTDGMLTALDYRGVADGGTNSRSPFTGSHAGFQRTFTCADAYFESQNICTNTTARGYWRCVQDPVGAFNYDIAINKMCEVLDMDPYEFRMQNLVPGDTAEQDTGIPLSGFGLKTAFETAHSESGYASKWHKPGTKTLPDGRMHGIAIAGHVDSHGGYRSGRGGQCFITPHGTVMVTMGGARGPSGAPTAMANVVGEALGMKPEDTYCTDYGNSDVTANAGMQAGSGFTVGAAGAFYLAGKDAQEQLFAIACTQAPFVDEGATPADLDAAMSEVFMISKPDVKKTYRDICGRISPVIGRGSTDNNNWPTALKWRPIGAFPIGNPCAVSGQAVTAHEVAVDTETGEVEILGMWNCVDNGISIFKRGAQKEMYSGCELQAWQALYAGDIYDSSTGAILSTNYTTSVVPTPMDLKTENLYAYDIQSDDACGAFGCKGMGEPCVTNYSAIICAIHNATGKWCDDPEKGSCKPDIVLKSLGLG